MRQDVVAMVRSPPTPCFNCASVLAVRATCLRMTPPMRGRVYFKPPKYLFSLSLFFLSLSRCPPLGNVHKCPFEVRAWRDGKNMSERVCEKVTRCRRVYLHFDD